MNEKLPTHIYNSICVSTQYSHTKIWLHVSHLRMCSVNRLKIIMKISGGSGSSSSGSGFNNKQINNNNTHTLTRHQHNTVGLSFMCTAYESYVLYMMGFFLLYLSTVFSACALALTDSFFDYI